MAQKKEQRTLLSFFSQDPPSKKLKTVEVQPSSLTDKSSEISDSASGPSTSNPKSSDIGDDNSGPSQESSVTIFNNKRDPCLGPSLAKQFIKYGPFQPNCHTFPVKNGRKFRPEWYKSYPWLEYSPVTDKGYCFACRTFHQAEVMTNADDAFSTRGFCNWKKAVSVFEKHQKSQSHISNSVKLASLKETEKSGTVAEKVNVQYAKNVQQNRAYLQAICETLIFCGRQTISLRGHDESTDSKNKGNFIELMKLRAKDNDIIRQFFVDRQKNFQYTSAPFQNELLSLIGDHIKLQISNKIREAKIFALIADETQDVSRHEQVAVVLRYVNERLEVHESFVGFYRAEKTDGESLANLLKEVIISLNLDIKNLRAQCYDGAANMRGPYKGVAARILEENPLAMYIHCNAHILNLCIVSCCSSVTSIRNTFFVLQSLYNFIEKTAKRHRIFEIISTSAKSFYGKKTTLKSLSDTRWACRVETVRSLLENFDVTLATLQEISTTDSDNGGQANALLNNIENFNFVFDLLLLSRILMQCDILSKALQSSSVTYDAIKSLKKSTIEVLKNFRTDDFFTQLFNHCKEIAEKCGFRQAEMPRISKIPAKFGGGDKYPYDNVEQYFKATILFPVIDKLVQEIEDRFEENNLNALNSLSKILSASTADAPCVEEVCKYYALDKELLSAELQCFYSMEVALNKNIPERALILVENELRNAFPIIFELFRLFYTIPMNSASCERSFSCLRRLRNYCRTTTGQERLSSLALLAIERDINIDINDIISGFTSKQSRRLHFF